MFLHPPKRQEENGEGTGTKGIDRSSFIPVRKWLPHRKARRLCVVNSQIKDKIQCKCLLLGMAKRTRAVLNGQCAHWRCWAGNVLRRILDVYELPNLAFMSPLCSPFLLELRPGFRPRLPLTPELAFTDSSLKNKKIEINKIIKDCLKLSKKIFFYF
jgi:hypothetical protein